ncbi:MAG TPA: phosphoribosyltransferase family protein [Pseudobacteroides sp.]|uniref:phosphoribosyltransferase family protein n=1 Tax=Pseudobacteroides sp. TaxID=1968840 RepID=UPI002F958AED
MSALTPLINMENKIYNSQVLDLFNVHIELKNNKYKLPMELLFSVGARINKKRRFLFVSKVLGKHIPVTNVNSLLIGALLAYTFLDEYYYDSSYYFSGNFSYKPQVEKIVDSILNCKNGKVIWKELMESPIPLSGDILFLAFAETATALGHSIFSCFDNADFIHTTREDMKNFSNKVVFEEEHSHATSHRVYPVNPEMLKSDSPIVLVDDEISTGKTVLNIIRELDKIHKRKEYIVLSILDFRSDADIEYLKEFEREYSLNVQFISLVSGQFKATPTSEMGDWNCVDHYLERNLEIVTKGLLCDNKGVQPEVRFLSIAKYFKEFVDLHSINDTGEVNSIPYLKHTGRFGINSRDQKNLVNGINELSKHIKTSIMGDKILFLGTEEFMFIPLLISSCIDKEIYYHSTTRSPIFPSQAEGYPISNRFMFDCPPNPSVTNFVYNIPYGFYDELYIFFERGFDNSGINSLMKVIGELGIRKVTVVFCSGDLY